MAHKFVSMALVGIMISSGFLIFTPMQPASAIQPNVNILEWNLGGILSDSWFKVNIDEDTWLQINFVVLNSDGGVTGYTKTNYSVNTVAMTNTNTNLAFLNISYLNSGEEVWNGFMFTRTTDVYGENQINVYGLGNFNDNEAKFNQTILVVNLYWDSMIDHNWWNESYDSQPIFWSVLGASSVSPYQCAMMDNGKMVLVNTNSGNYWSHVPNQQSVHLPSMTGYWGTMITNWSTYGRQFDVDGRLWGSIKAFTPRGEDEKERYGNVLALLPWANETQLVDISNNETIYQVAAANGITHVYLETFEINGNYEFDNAVVSAAVYRVRNYTHQYGMKFILPSYFWAFTDLGDNPVSTYTAGNRAEILESFQEYLDNFGPYTDEYSIGYAYISYVNLGTGWAWWSYDMLNEALGLITDEKDVSLWGQNMWYNDSRIIYLNNEGYADWNLAAWDAYFETANSHNQEPSYQCAGMRTWSFTMEICKEDTVADSFSYDNVTFDRKVLGRAFQTGAGITVLYHEELYASNDGFSLGLIYSKGMDESMLVTEYDVAGLTNGTLYEDGDSIAIYADNIAGTLAISPHLSKSMTTYFTALGIENTATDTYDATVSINAHGYGLDDALVFTTYEFRVYSTTVNSLVELAVDMVMVGIVVSVIGSFVIPLARDSNDKSRRKPTTQEIVREGVKTAIYVVIALILWGVLNSVAFG